MEYYIISPILNPVFRPHFYADISAQFLMETPPDLTIYVINGPFRGGRLWGHHRMGVAVIEDNGGV